MGLDGVELVMDVEDHFGIIITDGESAKIRTVADLVELCQQRIIAVDARRCMSLPCFLELRRTVRWVMADPTLRIRPSSKIADVLPPFQRRKLWHQLPSLLTYSFLPSLRRPWPLRIILIGVFLIAAYYCLLPCRINIAIWPLSLLGIVASGIVLLTTTRPFQIEPPEGFTTFGEITRGMTGKYVATKPPASTDPDSILAELRPIIANVLGVKEHEVVPTARFVEDLGVG